MFSHEKLMSELTKNRVNPMPDGETAKAINLFLILEIGIPEHQKIVRDWIEKGRMVEA